VGLGREGAVGLGREGAVGLGREGAAGLGREGAVGLGREGAAGGAGEDGGVLELARPRRGHYELGTGYHGDVWLDLDALFRRPDRLEPHVGWLAGQLGPHRVDAVCGPLDGGAFLALALATRLGTAFLPGYREPGGAAGCRLPRVPGGIGGWRVAIADDAVNAGTAIRACEERLRGRGAVPVAVAALLALGPARAVVEDTMGLPLHAAGQLPSQAWPASACLLCASGARLSSPS
jgi:orotate phosphoribosyltransferase